MTRKQLITNKLNDIFTGYNIHFEGTDILKLYINDYETNIKWEYTDIFDKDYDTELLHKWTHEIKECIK